MAGINDPRISFGVAPQEKLVQCPYDSSHLILEDRMTRHLLRCRCNYKKLHGGNLTMAQCIYNPHHYVYEKELAYHYSNCEYRKNKDFNEEREALKRYAPKPKEPESTNQTAGSGNDEDWGDELNALGISAPKAYPRQPKPDSVCFYVPPNMSQADKKAYRKALSARNREIFDPTFVRYQPIEEGDNEVEVDSGVGDIPHGTLGHVPDEPEEGDDHGEKDVIDGQPEISAVSLVAEGDGLSNASFAQGESKLLAVEAKEDEEAKSEIFFMANEAQDGSVTDAAADSSDDDEFWDARSRVSTVSRASSRH